MKYHLITALIILASVALYAYGLNGPSLFAFALGAAFELSFWVRFARHFRAKVAPVQGPR